MHMSVPCDNSSASFAAFISACWILCPDAFAKRPPRKYTATVYTLVFVGPLHSITLQTTVLHHLANCKSKNIQVRCEAKKNFGVDKYVPTDLILQNSGK